MSQLIRLPLWSALASCLATGGMALPLDPPTFAAAGLDLSSAAIDAEAPPTTHGFRAEADGTVRDLGMTAAHASNAAGLIVGEGPVEGGSRAMVWTDGTVPEDIGDLPGGDIASVARAVDARGRVVGRGHANDGDRAFVWTRAEGMRDLTVLAGAEPGVVLRDATGIDEDGRIVGQATVDGIVRAFVWTPQTRTLAFAEPGRGAGQRIVDLFAVATGGAAVGRTLSATGLDRPVAWTPGAPAIDLGDLPGGPDTGVARDIDELGWIVGHSATAEGDRAFVWQEESGMLDLNDLIVPPSDVVLTSAVSIIADGRILAVGRDGDDTHFYRLLPVAGEAGADRAALVAEKGVAELQSYTLADLGRFTGPDTPAPILAMDETGRVVGACDLTARACPRSSDGAASPGEDIAGLGGGWGGIPGDGTPGSGGRPVGEVGGIGTLVPATAALDDLGSFPWPRPRPMAPGLVPEKPFTIGTGPKIPDFPPEGTPPVDIAPVPLPAPWLALLAALGGLAALRRRPRIS